MANLLVSPCGVFIDFFPRIVGRGIRRGIRQQEPLAYPPPQDNGSIEIIPLLQKGATKDAKGDQDGASIDDDQTREKRRLKDLLDNSEDLFHLCKHWSESLP